RGGEGRAAPVSTAAESEERPATAAPAPPVAPPPPLVAPPPLIAAMPDVAEEKKPKKGSSRLATVLKLLVAGGLIAWLYRSGAIDIEKVADAAKSPAWLTQTIAVLFASISIITIRWWLLLRLEGIDIPLTDALKLTLVGHFWNNVLPG